MACTSCKQPGGLACCGKMHEGAGQQMRLQGVQMSQSKAMVRLRASNAALGPLEGADMVPLLGQCLWPVISGWPSI